MTDLEHFTNDLPDPESASRFLASLEEQHPRDAARLRKNEGLLSDVLTLGAYSPLLATTLLQNPEYLWWLNRKRRAAAVRSKDELLEALGRFVLTHSQLDLHTHLARFRRRELLRIFLSDIRRLATIAEITEDISNLADAILENALVNARQEMENRFGAPLTVDEKGRKITAEFCMISLGKLGSRELNYSSDIDLLFLYSAEGQTSGAGTRGPVTNREYFVKLSEAVTQLVGRQTGEGAAYRVDMRLRPHGRVGPLAMSVTDAIRYYNNEARDWERQVLIRSRASAGDVEIYKRFFEQVEDVVFKPALLDPKSKIQNPKSGPAGSDSAAAAALDSVRRSKQLIDLEQRSERGFNVKLGQGGIREIEFIAQALQLAYGGDDRWLRAPHTLISLSRLADRGLITEAELTELFNAYEFLRHLEHILQMENGLQTHNVPDEPARRALVGRRMGCESVKDFDAEIGKHSGNVHRVFARVFGSSEPRTPLVTEEERPTAGMGAAGGAAPKVKSPLDEIAGKAGNSHLIDRSRHLSQLEQAISVESDFRHRLGAFRRTWSELLDEIRTAEMQDKIDIRSAKRAQTALAEASIEAALDITRSELGTKYKSRIDKLQLAVMGLGKLGGGAIDYGSDLDLVLVYDDVGPGVVPKGTTAAEFYGRAVEILVTTLSSMTRDGSIYRVDLRLRPYGKNGQSSISSTAFAEYMRDTAVMWEWLAYVKIRAVAGDIELAHDVENAVRKIIHSRAGKADVSELANETRRVRMRLEAEKAGRRRIKDVDIKYGPGGMLDVYFAMRFLQLRDNIPDTSENRSTEHMLGVLHKNGSIETSDHETMLAGYRFLSALDHGLRLTVGRTTRLPAANQKALELISQRMNLSSSTELSEQLTLHRISIRAAFENIVMGN